MVKYIKFLKLTIFLLFSNAIYGASVEKFNWKASESAPENFLMRIVDGHFYDSNNGSLYIPNGKTLDQGWGLAVSSHVVGDDLKLLPCKLDITFFSYNEDKFYHGVFDLPYDKIVSEFNDGYFSPTENKNITYDSIVAGVSPGGGVSVWLDGIDKRKEVFFGKANEIKGDWHWINKNTEITREDYIKSNINENLTADAILYINKFGVPVERWEKYHKSRYYWYPKFIGIELRDDWIQNIKYYNGEEGYLEYPLNETELKQTRAIPEQIDFIWKYDKNRNYSYEMYFDEKEMFDVFEKYSSKNDPLELEIKMVKEGNKMNFTVALKNYVQDKGVYLKKVKVKSYGAD